MIKTDIPSSSQLIVALDVPTIWEAHALFNKLCPVVNIFKLGYWLLFDPDISSLREQFRSRDRQFFLDAKLNDIPETVKYGVRSAANSGADFITVHSEPNMLEAAMAGKGSSAIKVMAVTALTSQSASASRTAFRAAVINAIIARCDGLIMSPDDLTDQMQVRERAAGMLIATPGVRMAGTAINDHGRIGTPKAAIENGADYIIVGRPIIRADDPRAAAEQHIAELSQGQKPKTPIWQAAAKRIIAKGRMQQEETPQS